MSNYYEIKASELHRSAIDMISNGWLLRTAPDESKESGVSAMTASWGSLGELWYKDVATVYIRPQRYTMPLVEASERISLCFGGKDMRDAMKYCGTKSGRDLDKIKELGLECAECNGVKYIDGSEVVMICKKLYADDIRENRFTAAEPLDCYKSKDFHRFYILEIEKVLVKK